jgi:phospholipase D1/2
VILVEGRNCWKVAQAGRASFLIDAASYFAAFRQAVGRARQSVVILGWDVDSRTRLVPRDDGAPVALLPFLNHVLERRRDLRVYVLGWDFSVIYTFEREALPSYRFAWKAHSRLTFRLDSAHPIGASHHQKVVVIDDLVAFTGGLDLAIRRWDTPEHAARSADRIDPAGQPYPPMHDVQMVVDGEAARALGQLARARWKAATGRALPAAPPPDAGHDPWPADVVPELRDVPIGIARTQPAQGKAPDVQEVLTLNLDAIAAAQRWIYIENQYLTSATIGQALARRLEDPDGPEVVAVLPREECGWLEQSSMGIMRARLLRRLQRSDRFGRLRLFYPMVPDLVTGCVNVHSKVLAVDDTLAWVGSSNLSNRSMGLDTECDLVLDAGADPRLHGDIAAFRNRLLAEHLGTTASAVADALAASGSLIAAIDQLRQLRGQGRSLEPIAVPTEADDAAMPVNLAILDGLVCDPERPAPDLLIEDFVATELRRPLHRSLLSWGLVLIGLFALAAIWRLTPLRTLLNVDRMVALGGALSGARAAPLLVLAGYLGGALVLFPITLMLAATALVFDPVPALVYSLVGALSGAALTYGIGRLVGRFRQGWLSGPRISRLRRHLQRRGMVAIVAARLLPVGNFSLINIVAGALGIRFRDYMLGNVVGLLPGILGLTLFANRLGSTLRNPHPWNVVALGLVVIAIVAAFSWLRRRLARAPRPPGGRHA